MGSLADGHDSERVEEEIQKGKRHREREGGRKLEWTWDANLVLYSFLTVQDDDDDDDR